MIVPLRPPLFQQLVGYVFLLLVVCFVGCRSESAPVPGGSKKGGIKFPVEVATVSARTVDFSVHAVGSVEAFEIIQVTARVAGIVEKVRFREGDAVERGEALIDVEPERYRLALQSAQAQYDKACASLDEARAGLTRRIDIQGKNPGFVSVEDMDQWQTRVRAFQADTAQAAANLDLAKLNARDALVPAPESGIIQTRAVRTGQYLQTGTSIATLVRRDPLLLRFTLPEGDAARVRKGQTAQFTVRDDAHPYMATVTAVTDAADPVSRMVSVTAEVHDLARENLRPGSFAEVTVLLGESTELPVIPQLAIRPSERGFLAYVVQDSAVQERVLTLGMQSADGYVEVRNGITAGERIVVRGAEALRDKASVKVVSRLGQDRGPTADSTKQGQP